MGPDARNTGDRIAPQVVDMDDFESAKDPRISLHPSRNQTRIGEGASDTNVQ